MISLEDYKNLREESPMQKHLLIQPDLD